MRKILLIALVLAMLAGMDALAEAALEVTEAALQEDGSVRVEWTGGAAPYRVLFQPRVGANSDGPANDVQSWCNSGDVAGTSYYERCMVPDGAYWVIVSDADGHYATRLYDGGDCGMLPSVVIGATLRYARIRYIANGYTEADALDALVREDILNADDQTGYGFLLDVVCHETALYGDHVLRLAVGDVQGGPVLVGLIDYPINAESAPGITVRQDLSGWFADYLPRAKSYETFWISAYLDDKRIFLEPLAHLK